jgi:DNA-binding beta-propeller fold protein YncE
MRVFSIFAFCVVAFFVTEASAQVSFKKDIAPVLLNNCLACHGPKKAEGAYRIDSYERAIAPGESATKAFVPKMLEGSEAFRRIISTDVKERMPLDGDPLPAETIALIKKWVEEGAVFDGPDPKAPLASYIPPPTHPAAPPAYAATLPITAVTFANDGTQLYVGGYHEITVWNPVDGALIRRIANVGQRTFALSLSPDGTLLAVGCGTPGRLGEVRIFTAATGELQKVVGTTSDVVFDCVFSPQGDKIAVAAADGSIRVFQVADGKEILNITSHSDWVFAIAWNADASKLASASRDKTAKVFDAKTGELLITYSGHQSAVRGVLFHPDGAEVYSSGSDNKIHRWKIADAAKTSELPFGGEVYKLTPAGEFFLTSSAEQKVRQFKSKEQAAVREYPGAKDWVLSAAFNATTKRIAGGTFDGEVKIWNADDGKDVITILAAPGLKK